MGSKKQEARQDHHRARVSVGSSGSKPSRPEGFRGKGHYV
jgi:hypothetical protein